MNKKGAAGNLFVGHNILITNCAILFCGYCTAGASDSGLVVALGPVLVRYRYFFGSFDRVGGPYLEYSTRISVVCGAGLLYRKWYNENGYCAVRCFLLWLCYWY